KGPPHLQRDLGAHRATHDIAVSRAVGRTTQPDVGWLGELLLPGAGQPCLSSDRSARESSAASVVECQAPGAGSGNRTLPGQIPVRSLAISKAGAAHEDLLVGESLNPCPRAGCG